MYSASKAAIQMEILKPKNEQIDEYLGSKKQESAAKTVIYCRVSNQGQKFR
jgi:predicted site-specific integrase-resolvase